VANEPSADNAVGSRRQAFTKPLNDKEKVNVKQVKHVLRLPTWRYAPLINYRNSLKKTKG